MVLTLGAVFRLIALFTKRTFVENHLDHNAGAIIFYIFCDGAKIGALGLKRWMEKCVSFRWRVLLQIASLLALMGGLGSAAYSDGSKHGKKVDTPHYVSLLFTEFCVALDLVDSCRNIADDVCRYYKTQRLSNFWKLVQNDESSTKIYFQYLPKDEQEWVFTELTRRTWRKLHSKETEQQGAKTTTEEEISDVNHQPIPRASSSSSSVGTPMTPAPRVHGSLGSTPLSTTLRNSEPAPRASLSSLLAGISMTLLPGVLGDWIRPLRRAAFQVHALPIAEPQYSTILQELDASSIALETVTGSEVGTEADSVQFSPSEPHT